MKVAVVTYYAENYKSLADITTPNMREYCARHNYDFIEKNKDFTHWFGWEKIHFVKGLLEEKKYDWIWCIGVDTLITNLNITIEEKVDDNYHFIIARDVNGPNADSFLLRNSNECLQWINFICSKENEPRYSTVGSWYENQVIHDYYHVLPWSNIIKVVKQREMNSYLYDTMGSSHREGQWQKGDWLLHFVGLSLDRRILLAQQYISEVVK